MGSGSDVSLSVAPWWRTGVLAWLLDGSGEIPIPGHDLGGKPGITAGEQAVDERAAIADEADAAPVAGG